MTLLWSYIGASLIGRLESDEANRDKAVSIILGKFEKVPGFQGPQFGAQGSHSRPPLRLQQRRVDHVVHSSMEVARTALVFCLTVIVGYSLKKDRHALGMAYGYCSSTVDCLFTARHILKIQGHVGARRTRASGAPASTGFGVGRQRHRASTLTFSKSHFWDQRA